MLYSSTYSSESVLPSIPTTTNTCQWVAKEKKVSVRKCGLAEFHLQPLICINTIKSLLLSNQQFEENLSF